MAKRTAVEMALQDNLDIARTLVRLKHRMAARHELNDVEEKIRKGTAAKVLKGVLPKAIDTSKIIDLE